MGRRINISQPTVIETDLTPLSDNFFIDSSDTLEQWYYDNHEPTESGYSPDRLLTPLVLTPRVSAVDIDSGTEYTPTINLINWYVSEFDATTGTWGVEELITSSTTTDDYYKSGTNLVVRKNVSYTYGVTIKCQVEYLDPRDSGVRYILQDSISLSTNRDATIIYPTLDVTGEHTVEYRPLSDATSQFTFNAKAYIGAEDKTDELYFVWYAYDETNDTETPIADLDCFVSVSGQNNKTLTVDALYADNLTIVLRAKESPSASNLYPSKCFRSLVWMLPKMDAKTVCTNGSAVREGGSATMHFEQIITVKGRNLEDSVIRQHLAFLWKYRKLSATSSSASANVEVTIGWSPTIDIQKGTLLNTDGYSTPVLAEIYLLSPYERVTWQGEDVTYNGEQIFARNVFS